MIKLIHYLVIIYFTIPVVWTEVMNTRIVCIIYYSNIYIYIYI